MGMVITGRVYNPIPPVELKALWALLDKMNHLPLPHLGNVEFSCLAADALKEFDKVEDMVPLPKESDA